MPKPAVAPPEITVTTACPLDCPDACTLDVTLRGGRITKIDGSTENHITERIHLRQGAPIPANASMATIACSIRRSAAAQKARANSSA